MLIQLLLGFAAGTVWSLIWYQLYRTHEALAAGTYSVNVRLKSWLHWLVLLVVAYILLDMVITVVLGFNFNTSDTGWAEIIMMVTPIFWAIL